MRKNNLPDNSFEAAGSLQEYVDNFFSKRNLPYTYDRDVEPLFHKSWPWTIKADSVKVVPATFKKWQNRYNQKQNA